MALDPPDEVEPVAVRQAHVGEDEVERSLPSCFTALA